MHQDAHSYLQIFYETSVHHTLGFIFPALSDYSSLYYALATSAMER